MENAKEVKLAFQRQGEHIADHTHVTGKLNLEQKQVGRAFDVQVKVSLGRNGVAIQSGVGQGAGVDLQHSIALDLDDGDVELNLEAQVQGKVRVVQGV